MAGQETSEHWEEPTSTSQEFVPSTDTSPSPYPTPVPTPVPAPVPAPVPTSAPEPVPTPTPFHEHRPVQSEITTTTTHNSLLSKFCRSEGYGPTSLSLELDGKTRKYLVYLPAIQDQKVPIWFAMPGTFNKAEWFAKYTGLNDFGKQNGFGVVTLEGYDSGKGRKFNVYRRSQPRSGEPDDVEFFRQVLDQISAEPCVDLDRIYCTGWSNGGRFCAQLASQADLSERIAAIGPVSSLRYPRPNDARRAIPILAFQGTKDKVNPWKGDGNPDYWKEPIPGAFSDWVKFNGCEERPDMFQFQHIRGDAWKSTAQAGCKDDAVVQLVRLDGDGHPWPSATFSLGDKFLGHSSSDVSANEMLLEFFSRHTLHSGDQRVQGSSSRFFEDWSVPEAAEGSILQRHPRLSSFAIMASTAGLLALAAFGVCRRRGLHQLHSLSEFAEPLPQDVHSPHASEGSQLLRVGTSS